MRLNPNSCSKRNRGGWRLRPASESEEKTGVRISEAGLLFACPVGLAVHLNCFGSLERRLLAASSVRTGSAQDCARKRSVRFRQSKGRCLLEHGARHAGSDKLGVARKVSRRDARRARLPGGTAPSELFVGDGDADAIFRDIDRDFVAFLNISDVCSSGVKASMNLMMPS